MKFKKTRKALPWLMEKDVIKEIDVTNIGETQSYKHIFQKSSSTKSKKVSISALSSL
ncbi:MAG: hypothetical protein FWH05_02380 [Oscillospiraceae bacterium]|nr:hypothetical protein [Oscillospiraceae bacterium]